MTSSSAWKSQLSWWKFKKVKSNNFQFLRANTKYSPRTRFHGTVKSLIHGTLRNQNIKNFWLSSMMKTIKETSSYKSGFYHKVKRLEPVADAHE